MSLSNSGMKNTSSMANYGSGDCKGLTYIHNFQSKDNLDTISIRTTPKKLFKNDKEIKKGWIEKWRQSLEAFEKLWLILYPKRLVLCKDFKQKFLYIGYVNLSEIEIKALEDPRLFQVTKKQKYILKLRASDREECQSWINAIMVTKSKLTSNKFSGNEELSYYFSTVQRGLKALDTQLDKFSSCSEFMKTQCNILQELFAKSLQGSSSDKAGILEEVRSKTALFLCHAIALRNCSDAYLSDAKTQNKHLKNLLELSIQGVEKNEDNTVRSIPSLEMSIKDLKPLQNGAEPFSLTRSSSNSKIQFRIETFKQRKTASHSNKNAHISCSLTAIDILRPENFGRRKSIPNRKINNRIELWEILKNLLKNSFSNLPSSSNEPLSYLQYINSCYEYADLLGKASACSDATTQMAYVASFVISNYSHHPKRVTQPFTPLLGETYELDRVADLGWRSFSECVSLRPLTIAHYCKGKDWLIRENITLKSKILGRVLVLIPEGTTHLHFSLGNSGEKHYTWPRLGKTMHSVFAGDAWTEVKGELDITNETHKEKCNLNFLPYSSKEPFLVLGSIKNRNGAPKWVLKGVYNDRVEGAKVFRQAQKEGQSIFKANIPQLLWKRNKDTDGNGDRYYFNTFECQLNEFDSAVAPTDSRFRPDIRALEIGDSGKATHWKQKLEATQRKEARGKAHSHRPLWFHVVKYADFPKDLFQFKGKYWSCKSAKSWEKCPEIYG